LSRIVLSRIVAATSLEPDVWPFERVFTFQVKHPKGQQRERTGLTLQVKLPEESVPDDHHNTTPASSQDQDTTSTAPFTLKDHLSLLPNSEPRRFCNSLVLQ
jgi:hypothetical protein